MASHTGFLVNLKNTAENSVQDMHTDSAFHALIRKISLLLEAHLYAQIPNVLTEYDSNHDDWLKYTESNNNADVKYTRNSLLLLPENNGVIMILVWKLGKGSAIHNHPNCECWVKVLQGELVETLYTSEMERKSNVGTNAVTHINDSIGTHSMENISTSELAVSLHVYTSSQMVEGANQKNKKDCKNVSNLHGIYKDYSNEFEEKIYDTR